MASANWNELLGKVLQGQELTRAEATRAIAEMFQGDVPDEQLATFLLALRKRRNRDGNRRCRAGTP